MTAVKHLTCWRTQSNRYETDKIQNWLFRKTLTKTQQVYESESEIDGSINTKHLIHLNLQAPTHSNLTLTLLAAVNGNKIDTRVVKYVKEI